VHLQRLSIENCRIIEQWDDALSPFANILLGDNASGKSSVIEAICVLSRGRSFRTQRIAEVIRKGSQTLTVAGRVCDTETGSEFPLGIAKTADTTQIRINHADVKQQSELSTHLPLTVIHPDTIDLIVGSPQQRRALIDWVAFYREADFHQDWRNYQRILKQRNVCLKDSNQHYALSYWTEQLVGLLPRIQQVRTRSLQALRHALKPLSPLLEQVGEVKLSLNNGFPGSVKHDRDSLLRFFKDKQAQEIKQGTTLYGAHRVDMAIYLDNDLAARVASRGQLKLLGIALLLGQSAAITENDKKRGIIAIDDLASELDAQNQDILYQVLKHTQQQLIITGTRQPPMDTLWEQAAMFHVKQGVIQTVSA